MKSIIQTIEVWPITGYNEKWELGKDGVTSIQVDDRNVVIEFDGEISVYNQGSLTGYHITYEKGN